MSYTGKTHLSMSGSIACGASGELFSDPPERWIKQHPANRCGRCEKPLAGESALKANRANEFTPAARSNAR